MRTERGGETHEVVPVEGLGSEGGECARSGACGSLCACEVGRSGECERDKQSEGRHGYWKRKKRRVTREGKGRGTDSSLSGTTFGFKSQPRCSRRGLPRAPKHLWPGMIASAAQQLFIPAGRETRRGHGQRDRSGQRPDEERSRPTLCHSSVGRPQRSSVRQEQTAPMLCSSLRASQSVV